jgi:arginine deiminase
MKQDLWIDSEIGRLETVLVHKPGFEIETMTPQTAEELLYNDILPLQVVAREHQILNDILGLIANSYEINDLIADILVDEQAKKEVIHEICKNTAESRIDELMHMDVTELRDTLICGLETKKDSFSAFMSSKKFDLPPLPNMYFMRDSSMVFRDTLVNGAMANRVREPEAILTKAVFRHHPKLGNRKILFDGAALAGDRIRLEGGDFLVAREDVLLVGLSDRSSSEGLDVLIEEIRADLKKPFHIIAPVLPSERATIHLDMIFNIIDNDKAIVYEPYILGPERVKVIHAYAEPGKETKFAFAETIFDALKTVNIHLEPILCGGDNPLYQQREQWLSGNNFFTFEPGKIIGYDCNKATMSALEKAGFTYRAAEVFLNGSEKISDHKKLAIGVPGTELSRGGGGIRCMTLPVKRESLSI